MDLSCGSPPPPPAPPGVIRLRLRPECARANGIQAARSSGSFNARRACAAVRPSIQNAFETSRPSRQALQCLCSPVPRSARPAGPTHPPPTPASAPPAVAALATPPATCVLELPTLSLHVYV